MARDNLEHHANNEGREQCNGDKPEPPVDDNCPASTGNKDRYPAQQHPNLACNNLLIHNNFLPPPALATASALVESLAQSAPVLWDSSSNQPIS